MDVPEDHMTLGPAAANRAEHAARELRRLVLSLALRPGEALPERRLERLLGVSRSPVRQALAELRREGLVRRLGRSYHVAPIDLAELDELFAFRALLETSAVRWAAARRERAGLDAVEAILSGLRDVTPPEERLVGTARLHLALARASGNRFLADSLEALLPRVTRARYLELTTPESARRGDEEHRRIVRLVGEGRGDEAAEVMAGHLERTLGHLKRSVDSLGSRLRLVAAGEPA
ncbi:MAG TPA: GntR family transcriptional regulator [Trueperaceae bacterium]|nr:GntR family transcriptional regulator [Trueperaceae bacterium]